MAGQDRIDGRCPRVQHHRQPQGIVHGAGAVMDRLPWQTRAQPPAIALDDADAAGHVVDQLVAAAEQRGRHGRSVILQADPAGHDDRGRQDQLQHLEVRVQRSVIAVQEDAPAKVQAARGGARCGDEGRAAGKPPFGARLGPIGRAGGDGRGRRAGQALCPFGPGQGACGGQPVGRAGQVGRVAGRGVVGKKRHAVGRGVVKRGHEQRVVGQRDAVGGQGGTGVGIVQQTRQHTGRDLSAAPAAGAAVIGAFMGIVRHRRTMPDQQDDPRLPPHQPHRAQHAGRDCPLLGGVHRRGQVRCRGGGGRLGPAKRTLQQLHPV